MVSLKKQKNFYGSRVKILSPAKVNLYFNVTGTYPSTSPFAGYHHIESIIERISLCDEIEITVTKAQGVKIISNKKSLENRDNLCVKAASLLAQKRKLPFGFIVTLTKRIPMGSGLGGGSSNAASTLLGLNALLGLRLSLKELYALGACLGSDVNFFLSQSQFAYVQGRGEQVTPFNAKPLHHVIVWPAVNLSTKAVYQNTRVKLTKFLSNANIIKYALKKGDISLLKQNLFNALEESALSLCGQLRKAKVCFDKKGIFCRMTGSGSALYTISRKLETARFGSMHPKHWLVVSVKTF
ncbi:MAG: 4-(cytidine 5'-diphospho)-2-C-methyl-D-erythritol kinase [Candidatus Omnitrophica bacterium]|nr:4-(cytidine 5'-diphospho)-2-C-methyl-D-erythritol kinase [Candidatus Omnitrophota bacterium]